MADYLNNVACADNYTPACTIGPNFDARTVVITIANNPVLMQFGIGKLGDWRWTDEREFFAIPQSFQVGKVIGVRFRNANPGNIARVLAVLSGDDDPAFQSGIPFTGFLSAAGAITPIGALLTGAVSSAGAIVAGTGFTAVRDSAGNYTVTFTTPFAQRPIVVVTPESLALPALELTSVAANSFHVVFWSSNTAGTPLDCGFGFVATAAV